MSRIAAMPFAQAWQVLSRFAEGVGLVMLLAPALMPFWGWCGICVLILAVLLIAVLAVYRSRSAYRPLLPAEANAHPFAGARAGGN